MGEPTFDKYYCRVRETSSGHKFELVMIQDEKFYQMVAIFRISTNYKDIKWTSQGLYQIDGLSMSIWINLYGEYSSF